MEDTVTKEKLLEVVIRALPHAEQIRDFDLASEPKAIRFTWRGDRLRVDLDFHTSTVKGHLVTMDSLAIVTQALLQRTCLAMEAADSSREVREAMGGQRR